jgi:hypothetical protein
MTLRAWNDMHLREPYVHLIRVSRRILGAQHLWAALHRGKPGTGAGDVPVPPEVWDAQYRRGKWHYLGGHEELARYSVLVGYVQYFAAGGAVLDVSCGARCQLW